MISRILIKDAVVFDKVLLEPSSGLNIFSGPSGAGKSVLVSSLLSIFGFSDPNAALSEANLENIISDNDLVEDENVVKCMKKDKSRYYFNDSQISKKLLQSILLKNVRFLNHKDTSDISKESLLELIDLNVNSKTMEKDLKTYKEKFNEYQQVKKELEELIKNRAEIEEKREFTAYEVEKIKTIAPRKGEYEDLLAVKKRLSKKEKIEEAVNQANEIFNYESSVIEALDLSGEDVDFFSDAMNELRGKLENSLEKLDELRDIDGDELLDRIERVSSLVKRYGSEEESLEYLAEKSKELETYENFDSLVEEKKELTEKFQKDLLSLGEKISDGRKKGKKSLEKKVNGYLEKLKLSSLEFVFTKIEPSDNGIDEISLSLKGVNLKSVSSGEFNRLRLSLLATKVEIDTSSQGVLFLDEIDANVSGEESEAIADVVKLLSSKYQIFAISHQPQLSSKADSHFLVEKVKNRSSVVLLDSQAQTKEIARMISGKEITQEALNHASNLLKGN